VGSSIAEKTMGKGSARGRYGFARADWLEHPEVGTAEFAVLCALALFADERGGCWPSQGLIARQLKKSRPWVNGVIDRLAALGLVERLDRHRQDGGRRSSLYVLAGHDRGMAFPPPPVRNEGSVSPEPDSACQPADSEHESNDQIRDSRPVSASASKNPSSPASQSTASVPPEDWQPGDDALIWAANRYPEADLAASVEAFILKSRAKGYRYHDLTAGWRVWLIQDMREERGPARMTRMAPARPGTAGVGVSPAHLKYAAWASVAASGMGAA